MNYCWKRDYYFPCPISFEWKTSKPQKTHQKILLPISLTIETKKNSLVWCNIVTFSSKLQPNCTTMTPNLISDWVPPPIRLFVLKSELFQHRHPNKFFILFPTFWLWFFLSKWIYMLMGETNWKSALVLVIALVWNKFNYGLTLNKNPENKLNQFSDTKGSYTMKKNVSA